MDNAEHYPSSANSLTYQEKMSNEVREEDVAIVQIKEEEEEEEEDFDIQNVVAESEEVNEFEFVDDSSSIDIKEECDEPILNLLPIVNVKTEVSIMEAEEDGQHIFELVMSDATNCPEELVLSDATNCPEERKMKPADSEKSVSYVSVDDVLCGAPLSCTMCNGMFDSVKSLMQHKKTHGSLLVDAAFRCKICGQFFCTRKTLKRHVRNHFDKERFVCELCNRSFRDNSTFMTHKRRHTGERPFKCEICKKSFPSSSDLGRHLRTHIGIRPFFCEICSKQFCEKTTLNAHMHTHFGIRPFHCKVCGLSYTQRNSLTVHMRVHTGERPYSCMVCNRSFGSKPNLTRHIRTHTGDRPFKCETCDKSFLQRCNLNIHIRTHTGDMPFSCKTCNRSFGTKGNLKRHMRIHTGDRSVEHRVFTYDDSVVFSTSGGMESVPMRKTIMSNGFNSFESQGCSMYSEKTRQYGERSSPRLIRIVFGMGICKKDFSFPCLQDVRCAAIGRYRLYPAGRFCCSDEPDALIFMSNEVNFHLEQFVNHQNFRYWALDNPRELLKRPLYSLVSSFCLTQQRRLLVTKFSAMQELGFGRCSDRTDACLLGSVPNTPKFGDEDDLLRDTAGVGGGATNEKSAAAACCSLLPPPGSCKIKIKTSGGFLASK
ncbi:hypothetical protein C0J52_10452 [Blattella germanica]|nr:hypothetical protein C0J52_10452 [Blattella germanica]